MTESDILSMPFIPCICEDEAGDRTGVGVGIGEMSVCADAMGQMAGAARANAVRSSSGSRLVFIWWFFLWFTVEVETGASGRRTAFTGNLALP